jgi:hypothetical protein
MRVKCMCDVEVVCDERFEPGLVGVDGGGVGLGAEGDVGASTFYMQISTAMPWSRLLGRTLRRISLCRSEP